MCVAERRPARDARPAARQPERARATRSSRACPEVLGGGSPTFVSGPRQARALADWLTDRAEPADGPGDGQPDLAVSLRPRDRADAQRLRRAGRAGHAPRAARLAGRRAHGRRLAAQADAPADRALERLPDVVAGRRRRAGRRPGESLVLAVPDAPAHRRGGSRLDPGRQRRRSTSRPADRASIRRSRAKSWPASRCRARDGRPRRPTRPPGGASTSTSSGRSWSRSWRPTTRPTPTSVARCATRPRCRRRRSAS